MSFAAKAGAFQVHAEMELASGIHRVLVPIIETRIRNFEFYGPNQPSGQVGGDADGYLAIGDHLGNYEEKTGDWKL